MKRKTFALFTTFLLSLMLFTAMPKAPSYVQAAQACPLCTKTMGTIYIDNWYSSAAEIHYDAYWYCYDCNVRDDYPYCTWDSHDLYQADFAYQTCETDGWYRVSCAKCGASEIHITGYATGHSWTDWYEENAASCFNGGKYSRYCTECYLDDFYTTPKTSHEGGQWHLEYCASDYGPGKKVQNCKYCGIELGVEWVDHSYGSWTLVQAATCSTPGKEVARCQYCPAETSRLLDTLPHSPGGWVHVYYPADDDNGYDYQACSSCGAACDSYEYPLELPDLNDIPQVLMPLAQELSPHEGLVLMAPLIQEDGAKDLEMFLFDPSSGTIRCRAVEEADDYRIDLYKETSEGKFSLLEKLTAEGPVFQLNEKLENHGDGAYSVVVWARKDGHRISAMVPAAFVYLTRVPKIQNCQVVGTDLIWVPGRHLPDDVIYQVDILAEGEPLDQVFTADTRLDMEPYGDHDFTVKIKASSPYLEDSSKYTAQNLKLHFPTYYQLEEDTGVYTLADSSSDLLGTLKKGDKIRVWEKKGTYCKLDYEGYESWIPDSALTPISSKAGLKVTVELWDGADPLILYTAFDGSVRDFLIPPVVSEAHPGEKIIGYTTPFGSYLMETLPAVEEDTTFYVSWGKDPEQVKITLNLPSGNEQEVLYGKKGTCLYGLPSLYENHAVTWFTEKEGEGTEYRNGFFVPTDVDEMALYGVIGSEEPTEREIFTVAFDPGLGACEYYRLTALDPYKPEWYGSANLHTIPLAYSGEDGKVFTCWRCDSEKFIQANGTDQILPGQKVVLLQDEIFTAVYEPETDK